jgi:predicted DNA-binding transcriptional regulator AlpA
MNRQPQPLQSRDLDPQSGARRDDTRELLTQVQVCQRLGISDQSWMRWRKAGRTPEAVTLPSGRLKWRVSDIDALTRVPERSARRRHFASAREGGARQLVAVR